MELKIEDNKTAFYQWDTGQKLILEDAGGCGEVHFCRSGEETALVCPVREEGGRQVVDVPNILLQTDGQFWAYLFLRLEDGSQTIHGNQFAVNARPKPESYVYTETEVLDYGCLARRLEKLEGEGLRNALEAYLKENPVQAGATEEEAARIQQNRENIEKLSRDKLDASRLPEAVNEALAQAKASGEFDGKAGNYPDWSNLKWYVMGDSLTERNAITSKHYYDFVQEKTGIQLIVDGIGGTGYGAGASTGQSFQERVKNIPADVDIVTIFGSGNDIVYLEVGSVPIWQTLEWLGNHRPGLRVIVVPPSPWKGYDKRSDPWKAYCDKMQTCALACNFRYVSDMYDCPPFSPNFNGHMETFFTTDPAGVHPDENGHRALAPYFYNALLQELALKPEADAPKGGGL